MHVKWQSVQTSPNPTSITRNTHMRRNSRIVHFITGTLRDIKSENPNKFYDIYIVPPHGAKIFETIKHRFIIRSLICPVHCHPLGCFSVKNWNYYLGTVLEALVFTHTLCYFTYMGYTPTCASIRQIKFKSMHQPCTPY